MVILFNCITLEMVQSFNSNLINQDFKINKLKTLRKMKLVIKVLLLIQ